MIVMGSKPWAKSDEYTLLQGVGICGLDWFQRRIGRTLDAVVSKARRVYGSSSLTRGAYTLRGAARRTGYHVLQLRRGQSALRQKWKRTSPHGSFLIYEEQLDELVAWLKTDYWSGHHRLYGCLWCDTDCRSHYALGLCRRCYQRYAQRLYRGGFPTSNSDLLQVVRENLKLVNAVFLVDVETQLARGRALTEHVLVQLIDRGVLV